MQSRWLAATAIVCVLIAQAKPVSAADDATLFRLFLKDGSSLVSYGEFARVGDRVVFSMPTDATPNPPLQLVNIAADRVDWDRTARYLTSARAAQYTATRAEDDYTALTNEVARTLNEVGTTNDPSKRLAIVVAARKTLAAWPAEHFNYRVGDVRQMLTLLDDAIASLRSATGNGHFDLNLVAYGDAPVVTEPVLPPPTPKDAIEQTLLAARVVDSAAERASLLGAALVAIDKAGNTLPPDWAKSVRDSTARDIDAEIAADRAYAVFREEITHDAAARAKMADVVGVQRIAAQVAARDATLGHLRPDVVNAIVEEVDAQLDAARRLRLARDRWAMQLPALRHYRQLMEDPVNMFSAVQPGLESIKALAGSTSATLAGIQQHVAQIAAEIRRVKPPASVSAAHALFVSALQMADHAAQLRREATVAGDMGRAWDASSAAAGALMLGTEALNQMQAAMRAPAAPIAGDATDATPAAFTAAIPAATKSAPVVTAPVPAAGASVAAKQASAPAPAAPAPATVPAARAVLPAPAPRQTPSVRAASSSPAPVGPAASRIYEILVASFKTDARAKAAQAAVQALGVPAQQHDVGNWHQVTCGPFTSRSGAVEAQQRLARAGYSGTLIVPTASQSTKP